MRILKKHVISSIIFLVTISCTAQDSKTVVSEQKPQEIDRFAGRASRPYRPPTYNLAESQFLVPAGMEAQVKFWTRVYSEFTSEQGVIHDSENLDLIYEVVDFKPINDDSQLTDRQKRKAREKLVDEAKERILEALKNIQKMSAQSLSSDFKIELKQDGKGLESLSEYEKNIAEYYLKFQDPSKIKEATDKNRIRFQLGQKDRMEEAIYLSGRYIEEMEKIFSDAGLPTELTRLVFVESSFNVFARSKVGASGLWQIMPYTGRGRVMMNGAIDKRNHPMEATKLAAKLLSFNYNMLNSWPLAVTGYNHGPAGVKKMVEKYQTDQLPHLIQNVNSRRSFGFASRNFYACFLAALEVERNAQKYFPKIVWAPLLDKVDIKLSKPISYRQIVKWFDGDDKLAQTYNPHIMNQARSYGRLLPIGAEISIPTSKKDVALTEINDLKVSDKKIAESGSKTYVVATGDTLIGIAQSFGVKVSDILALNDIDSPSKIKAGQSLKIP